MKVSDEFSGGLMKAADFGKDTIYYTIIGVKLQQFKEDEPKKLVLTFEETVSELALNATNRKMLVEFFGDETDDWTGQRIGLYKGKANFGGNLVDSIKIDDRPAPTSAPAPRNVPANVDPRTHNAPRAAHRAAVKERTRELAAVGAEDEDDGDPFASE